ncbi:probable glutamate carboxypeptidase LAMP1 isoform X2 [Brachypodium distachyon]|uniref:probable glutamate carboxypeptidase LAMP1 isoform X2 n=1 Tax=Brachypodium distachyon TaxID=15368 RepID=UPI0001C72C7B|nr:probable glutamate carboxypeptidase LAMP1 isoform X2 [Brachypodium distachyon]|eukprot:XP_010232289.1 probable glutamate carboxypeptidase LAMP1 isoform X2 [Brachypodium distachyon]
MSRLDAASLLLPSPPPIKPHRRGGRLLPSALAVLGGAVVLVVFVLLPSPPNPPRNYGSLFLSLGSNDTAASHLRALTLHPHVAGTKANSLTAAYVLHALSSLSFPAHITPYSVLLSYPVHRSLSLSTAPGGRGSTKSFSLVQETYPNDPYAPAAAEVIPTFFAYSASGSMSAEAVYANYGREEDFAYLASRGVDVAGKVALARYGRIHCEDIVYNARVAGAAAAVVYTDPLQYGGAPGEGSFPNTRWLPPTGVQVGSLFRGVGDPTTPMWASSEGCERVSVEDAMATDDMPRIPALPVSARDATEIHRVLGGAVAPVEWQGRGDGPVYHLGPGPAVLNLTYAGNDTMATIENVFAVIEGEEEPDRYVILGNHRDAWTFGAADPNSGTAAMIELAHRFSMLQKQGWRPRRTIILCSWDAEEYGLTGSTEWVEENREMLSSRAVAYLNVDVSVVGPVFQPCTTPQLDELLLETIKLVQDPDNSSQTVYDSWVKSNVSPKIGRLGDGGSDYSAFVQHVGIPSTNMIFGEGPGYPVYHSLYDDFVWMEKFGDPGFRRHVAAASIWGIMALRLADEEIIPFDYMSYTVELEKYTEVVERDVRGTPISCSPLYNSIKALKRAATKVNNERKEILRELSRKQLSKGSSKVRGLNDRLMQAERAFTNREGIFKQEWFKHLIYGPLEQNDWDTASYPGIANAIAAARSTNTSASWKLVEHEIHRVARAVMQASAVLGGSLT